MLIMAIATIGSGSTTSRVPPSPQTWLKSWRSLVQAGKIMSVAELSDGSKLRYGVVLHEATGMCVEYCEGNDAAASARAGSINGYEVILRASRALRPPAAPNFAALPPHDEAVCSLCSGPLRLALRPAIAYAELPSGRCWDVHYNIAPIEPNGHFLLVPDISLPGSRRAQRLLAPDAVDLWHINEACSGGKNMCFVFNSPNAGASQNHIHAHAWVFETPYPITRARAIEGTATSLMAGAVRACVLDWPASVIRLSGTSAEEVGAAIFQLCEMAPVHNVAYIGKDTFFFARSAEGEVSDAVPNLKVGAMQLLGLYVVDENQQFDAATVPGAIERSLRATRFGDGTDGAVVRLLEQVAKESS